MRLGTVAAIGTGAVGFVVLAPVALGAAGFTSAGIAAGSLGAKMMSAAAVANGGGVAAGSMVAVLQSAGAAGLSGAANAALAATGGAVGWLTSRFFPGDDTPTDGEEEALPTVSDFLRDRNVPEETISYLEKEKIDKDVILLMEDGHLAKFIPSLEDRLALVDFCRSQTTFQRKKKV